MNDAENIGRDFGGVVWYGDDGWLEGVRVLLLWVG